MAKKLVKCDLGISVVEEAARELDELVKTLPAECSYRKKSAVSTTELVEGERSAIAMITTETIDRDKELVVSKGINVETYNRNPVVCWNHDWDSPPIGKCQWVKKTGDGLRAKTVFAERPKDWSSEWFPDAVFSLVQQGIVKSVSIGFLPTKLRSPTDEDVAANPSLKDCRTIIEEAILLEYSFVPIPCNSLAVVEAVSKGIHLDQRSLDILGFRPVKLKKRANPAKTLASVIDGIQLDAGKIAAAALSNIAKSHRV